MNINNIISIAQSKVDKLLIEYEKNENKERFPFVTKKGKWTFKDSWSNGFFIGLLLSLYDLKKDSKYLKRAEEISRNLDKYIEQGEFQDIGYIFYYSYAYLYEITQKKEYRQKSIKAADNLYNSVMFNKYLKCNWLEEGNQYLGVDSFMNMGLWCWAYKTTKNKNYLNTINRVAYYTSNILVSDDGRTSEYAKVIEEGEKIQEYYNKNAISGETVWSRGHVWVIYGLVTLYELTEDKSLLKILNKLIEVYEEKANDDLVPYWDLFVRDRNEKKLVDSSAAAAFGSAICRLYLKTKNNYHLKLLKKLYKGLVSENYINTENCEHEGILLHASTPFSSVDSPNESQIWGDYFLLELLINIKKVNLYV